MAHWLIHLVLYTLIQVTCFVIGLEINERLRTTYPSATILPITVISLMLASAIWTILPPFGKSRPTMHSLLGSWRFVAGALVLCPLLTFAIRYAGFEYSRGKVILLLLQILCTTPLCYLISREVSTWNTSWIWRSKAFKKSLAVSVGMLFCITFIVLSEAFFGSLLFLRTPSPVKEYRGEYLTPSIFFRQDSDLGTALQKNQKVNCELLVNGQPIWNVHYSTDNFGRRLTTSTNASHNKFAIFFGCSYLFGEGANDSETTPSQFSLFCKDYHSYNYGVPGYGTQHMLALLESGVLPKQVTESTGIGVYLYLPEIHESRVIGDMDTFNGFASDFPYYYLNQDGRAIRYGNFTNSRPLTNFIYNLLGKSHIRQFFGLNFPRRNDSHYQLTGALIAQSAELFRKQFPGSTFYVVAYPNSQKQPLRVLELIDHSDTRVIDFSKLFKHSDTRYHYQGDGHPTPAANTELAKELAKIMLLPNGNIDRQKH